MDVDTIATLCEAAGCARLARVVVSSNALCFDSYLFLENVITTDSRDQNNKSLVFSIT